MYQSLYSELEQVILESEQVLKIVNDIFNALVNEELNALSSLNSKQSEGFQKIKLSKDNLREIVESIAKQHNIDGYRIQSILHLFTQNERENILDLIKLLIELENKLEVSLHRNKDYLGVLMSISEDKIDRIVYLNQKETQKSVFLNKKF